MLNNLFKRIAMIFLLTALAAGLAHAQGTAFTYQGHLTDSSNPADGMYDMQFKLFDTSTAGMQQGMTLTFSTVQVENGVFTVLLNFGAGIFTGPSRFLEIGVRPTGSPNPYTILDPRQEITTAPYALRAGTAGGADTATNAAQLGGVAASQYVLTTDSRMTDSRNPLAGSNSYIQNSTTLQASTSFHISGTGLVGGDFFAGGDLITSGAIIGSGIGITDINANNITFGTMNSALLSTVPANKGGTGLTSPGASLNFLRSNGTSWSSAPLTASDIPAGSGNYIQNRTTPQTSTNFNISGTGTANIQNAVTQYNLGGSRVLSNAGSNNLFAGVEAGNSNTSGSFNSLFGVSAGLSNTSGSFNSFFGSQAGGLNTTGGSNSFFGVSAGESNTTGSNNSFFGTNAGDVNTTGSNNTFVGHDSGDSNTIENNNTFIGSNAQGAAGISNATAIGRNAQVTQSNSLVLGSINGVNTATASVNVGIGTTAPKSKLHIQGGNIYIAQPNSLIITSPNGSCWFITVNNSGVLSTISTPCP